MMEMELRNEDALGLVDAIVDALNDFEEHGLHAKECDCTYCNGVARLREAYKKATGQR